MESPGGTHMSTLVESKRLHNTRHAYALVVEAYERLTACGAIDAAARVKSTLNSVRGAVRYAEQLDVMGDEDLAARRRRRRPKQSPEALERLPGATKLIKLIQMELSGKEWNADTLERVASLLRANGIPVLDIPEVPEANDNGENHDCAQYFADAERTGRQE